MDTVTLNNLRFDIDWEALQKELHLTADSPYFSEIQKMASEAQLIARPKAVYRSALIEVKGDNFVVIEGIQFTSRILRVNLEETTKVYPFVVTCGTEIEDWSKQFAEDYYTSYCADIIKAMILYSARDEFEACLDQEFELGHAVDMNPGSLTDWPLSEQKPLFRLLGQIEELSGVQLTDSYLLLPMKSVSGIRFPKEGTYENCQLCPREKCPSRKALYDKELYQKKYQ